MRHGMFVLVIDGLLVGDLQRNLVLTGGYLFAVYATVLYAAVPMTFRYMVVCREHTVSQREFMFLILLVIFLASWPPAAHFYSWWTLTLTTTRQYADLIDDYSCQDAGQMYISPLSEVLWANALPFIVVSVIVFSAYAVIVFCAYKVSRKVKSVNNWSARAHDANKQIHAALIFQATTPLILDVIPVGMSIVAIVCGVEQLQFATMYVTSFLAWIPVVNPLSAMFFIRCYRTAVRKFTRYLLRRVFVRLGWESASPCGTSTSRNAVSPLPSTNNT